MALDLSDSLPAKPKAKPKPKPKPPQKKGKKRQQKKPVEKPKEEPKPAVVNGMKVGVVYAYDGVGKRKAVRSDKKAKPTEKRPKVEPEKPKRKPRKWKPKVIKHNLTDNVLHEMKKQAAKLERMHKNLEKKEDEVFRHFKPYITPKNWSPVNDLFKGVYKINFLIKEWRDEQIAQEKTSKRSTRIDQ